MNAVMRMLTWVLAIALVAMPVVALVNGWVGAERWPLRTLRVQGNLHRVDAAQLRATVLPYVRSGYFAMHLDDAQAAVAKLPWVARAEVSKRWPDVVEVRVTEHRPFARWGNDQVISEQGGLFAMPKTEARALAGLPHLYGPTARVHDVITMYNESSDLFARNGVQVRALAMDTRGSWALDLSNGIRLTVGRSDASSRLQRFARLMPQLAHNGARALQRADLRYTNGFALQWAEVAGPTAPDQAAAAAREPAVTKGSSERPEVICLAPSNASGRQACADAPRVITHHASRITAVRT